MLVVVGARENEDCSGFVVAGLAGVAELAEVVAVLLGGWGVFLSAEARRKARVPLLRRRGRMAEDIMRVMVGVCGGEDCSGSVCCSWIRVCDCGVRVVVRKKIKK